MRQNSRASSPAVRPENIKSIDKNVYWRRYRAEIALFIGLTFMPFFWYYMHSSIYSLSFPSYTLMVIMDILIALCMIYLYYKLSFLYYVIFGKRYIEVQMPPSVIEGLIINTLIFNNYIITNNPQCKLRDVTIIFDDMERYNIYLINGQYLLEIYFLGAIQDSKTLTSIYLSIKQRNNHNKVEYKMLYEIILNAINNHVERLQ